MKRIHIIGRKNSGKTTLIVALVEHLTQLGYRVGTIKHTHHQHELDTPGKDSYWHRQAGAPRVAVLAPGMTATFQPNSPPQEASERYDQLATFFSDCDLVLVEGHVQATGTRIEVWRSAVDAAPIASSDGSIAALVTDDATQVAVPIWPRKNVPFIASRLLEAVAISRLASCPAPHHAARR